MSGVIIALFSLSSGLSAESSVPRQGGEEAKSKMNGVGAAVFVEKPRDSPPREKWL